MGLLSRIGTNMGPFQGQIWDIITSTVLVIWIFSFPRQNFLKPRPRLFSETKFFRNQNRDFFSVTKFSETETLKDLAKVSKPRDFETEMSISGHDQLNLSTTDVFFVACIVYLPNICAAHVFKKVLIESPRLR